MSKVEVITSVERRRKWSENQKLEIVKESEEGGVSYTARKYKIPTSQLFYWRKHMKTEAAPTTTERNIVLAQNTFHSLDAKYTDKIKFLEQVIGRRSVEIEYLKDQLAMQATKSCE